MSDPSSESIRHKPPVRGWFIIALAALIPAKLFVSGYSIFNWPVFVVAFLFMGSIYWRRGAKWMFAVEEISSVMGSEPQLEAVLEPGWQRTSGISGTVLNGTFKRYPICFEYVDLPNFKLQSKYQGHVFKALMVECGVRKNFHLSIKDVEGDSISDEFFPLRSVPGFEHLFSVANAASLLRLGYEPFHWIGKQGLLLILSDVPYTRGRYKSVLETLVNLAIQEGAPPKNSAT